MLVDQLVQHAEAASARGRGDLADDGQHASVRPVAAGEGRAGVEQTGPGHDAERRRPAGDQRRAVRHVGGALLVAGDDRADVSRVDQGVEEVVVLHPGEAEQGVDAGQPDRLDDLPGDRAGVVALTGHRGLSLRLLERRGHGARARARPGSCRRRPERWTPPASGGGRKRRPGDRQGREWIRDRARRDVAARGPRLPREPRSSAGRTASTGIHARGGRRRQARRPPSSIAPDRSGDDEGKGSGASRGCVDLRAQVTSVPAAGRESSGVQSTRRTEAASRSATPPASEREILESSPPAPGARERSSLARAIRAPRPRRSSPRRDTPR